MVPIEARRAAEAQICLSQAGSKAGKVRVFACVQNLRGDFRAVASTAGPERQLFQPLYKIAV